MGRHLLWLTAVVAACATEHAPSSDDPTDGETQWYVLAWLDVAAPDPAGDPPLVPGFDIDGIVSTETDPRGCFHQDWISPSPDRTPGIDNQLALSYASCGIAGCPERPEVRFRERFGAGELIAIELGDVHDRRDDPRVTVILHQATADGPILDADGRVRGGLAIRPVAGTAHPVGETALVDGRIEVGLPPESPSFTMPMFLGLYGTTMEVDALHLSAAPTEGELVLGAALHVDEALRALLLSGTEESLARSIIEGQADLWPDESGECTAISFALVGAVVPASRAD